MITEWGTPTKDQFADLLTVETNNERYGRDFTHIGIRWCPDGVELVATDRSVNFPNVFGVIKKGEIALDPVACKKAGFTITIL